MKKTIVALALVSTAISSPALARDDSWYIQLDAGATQTEDHSFDVGVTPNAVSVGHNVGPDIGLVIGHDFGAFRIEAEGSYRRVHPTELVSTIRLPGSTAASGPGFFIGRATQFLGPDTYESRAESKSAMLNGLLDFGDDDGLQGYVGGGVGFAQSTYRISMDSRGPGWLDDSDSGFAWQALAGFRVPINNVVDLGLKYRFLNVNNVDLVDTGGRAVQTRWRSHSLMATFGFNFGGAAPPPCNKGPYIVFFDWDKSDITPEAASILDSAVTAYGNCASVPIMLAGYADRSGGNVYNQGLSERRNASVTEYLTSRGISAGAITSQGFGENNNRVPTADGVRELQNRRVEITYGPGSGM